MKIRATTVADREAVIDLVRRAFSTDGRDGQEEVDIVEETWRRGEGSPAERWRRGEGSDGMDLVAERSDGGIAGHVLAARGRVGDHAVLGIAPLAVAPDDQGVGVGSALMRHVIAEADERGEPMLVLLGNPRYYGRFGFEPAADAGLLYAPVGETPAFQVRRLSSYDPEIRGEYAYCWELPLTLP